MKKLAYSAGRFGSSLFDAVLMAVVVCMILQSLVGTASAQAVSNTVVNTQSAFTVVQPWLVMIVALAIAAIVGWICYLVQKTLGLMIDASMRNALQTALTNAAGLALNALGNKLPATIDVKNPVIADVVNYVIRSVPDALAHFDITPDKMHDILAEKVLAKLPQVAATPAAPAVPAAV